MVEKRLERRFVIRELVDDRRHENRRIEEHAHLLDALARDPTAARMPFLLTSAVPPSTLRSCRHSPDVSISSWYCSWVYGSNPHPAAAKLD